MSYNVGSVCAGPAIQVLLQDHFRTCGPHGQPFDVGTLMFVRSAPNMDNVMQQQLTANTQRRTVQVVWMQRDQKSNVTESCTQNCDGGDEEGTNCESYEITGCIDRKWTVNPVNWEESERPLGDWFPFELQSKMNAMSGRLNEELVTSIAANFGDFASLNGTGPFLTQTACPTTLLTETSHALIEDVSFEALDSGYCTTPTVIGYGEAYKWTKRIAAGCCIDPLGLDNKLYSMQNPIQFIPDRTIEEVLGTNHFISLDMGAVQLFTWNRFQGPLRTSGDDSYFQRVIIDPFTGIPYDFVGKNDCGTWSFQLMLHYLVAYSPDNSFPVGDQHFNVNGVQHFLINNVC